MWIWHFRWQRTDFGTKSMPDLPNSRGQFLPFFKRPEFSNVCYLGCKNASFYHIQFLSKSHRVTSLFMLKAQKKNSVPYVEHSCFGVMPQGVKPWRELEAFSVVIASFGRGVVLWQKRILALFVPRAPLIALVLNNRQEQITMIKDRHEKTTTDRSCSSSWTNAAKRNKGAQTLRVVCITLKASLSFAPVGFNSIKRENNWWWATLSSSLAGSLDPDGGIANCGELFVLFMGQKELLFFLIRLLRWSFWGEYFYEAWQCDRKCTQ